jgi:hypothetical protein
MAERLGGMSYHEIITLNPDVRGIKSIKLMGDEIFSVMMDAFNAHLHHTISTVEQFGVIAPTMGLYMANHPDNMNMMVMHMQSISDENISEFLPKLEENTVKYSGMFLFISAEATIKIKQKDVDNEINEYEIDGIKTSIYSKFGPVDFVSEIKPSDIDDRKFMLSKPIIIDGKGNHDYLFDHLFQTTTLM